MSAVPDCLSGAATERSLRPAFDRLAEVLMRAARGRKVVFLQNPGNFGDALIRHGTLRFFEDIGLEVTELDMGRRDAKLVAVARAALERGARPLFLYAGGGAWCRAGDHGGRNVRRLEWLTSEIIVLPTTFEHFGLRRPLTVFRRDEFESRAAAPQSLFCHDMALYLALVEPDRLLSGRTPPDRRFGMMFRTDVERRVEGYSSCRDNVDLSAQGDHLSDPSRFLREIDRYETIFTDRLHVAIGAALLGKSVRLVTGSYFKIAAIYRSSLAGVFDNVRLIGDDAELAELLADQVREK